MKSVIIVLALMVIVSIAGIIGLAAIRGHMCCDGYTEPIWTFLMVYMAVSLLAYTLLLARECVIAFFVKDAGEQED